MIWLAVIFFVAVMAMYAAGYALCVWLDKHPAPYGRMGTWPVEVPVQIRDERGHRMELHDRRDGYVGSLYVGEDDSPLPPATLTVSYGRGWVRKKLNSGEWTVISSEKGDLP